MMVWCCCVGCDIGGVHDDDDECAVFVLVCVIICGVVVVCNDDGVVCVCVANIGFIMVVWLLC